MLSLRSNWCCRRGANLVSGNKASSGCPRKWTFQRFFFYLWAIALAIGQQFCLSSASMSAKFDPSYWWLILGTYDFALAHTKMLNFTPCERRIFDKFRSFPVIRAQKGFFNSETSFLNLSSEFPYQKNFVGKPGVGGITLQNAWVSTIPL